jgi:hypothetical protein
MAQRSPEASAPDIAFVQHISDTCRRTHRISPKLRYLSVVLARYRSAALLDIALHNRAPPVP